MPRSISGRMRAAFAWSINDTGMRLPFASSLSMTTKRLRTMATNSALSSSVLLTCVFVSTQLLAAPLSCPAYRHGFRLATYGIFDGDPAKKYEQAPDNEGSANSTYIVRRRTSDQPDGFHLLCTYHDKTKLRPADPGIRHGLQTGGIRLGLQYRLQVIFAPCGAGFEARQRCTLGGTGRGVFSKCSSASALPSGNGCYRPVDRRRGHGWCSWRCAGLGFQVWFKSATPSFAGQTGLGSRSRSGRDWRACAVTSWLTRVFRADPPRAAALACCMSEDEVLRVARRAV